ncbi:MAG TPA: hypothetical protein PKC89_11190 [Pyrinomonadaceae bacterium]|nr:hypothetical protein [Pyrinomonadaceae bacterium]
MEDTNRKVRAVQQRIWMSFSESERFRKGAELFDLARKAIVSRAPNGLSEDELKRFVFEEMYGFEMPKAGGLDITHD